MKAKIRTVLYLSVEHCLTIVIEKIYKNNTYVSLEQMIFINYSITLEHESAYVSTLLFYDV